MTVQSALTAVSHCPGSRCASKPSHNDAQTPPNQPNPYADTSLCEPILTQPPANPLIRQNATTTTPIVRANPHTMTVQSALTAVSRCPGSRCASQSSHNDGAISSIGRFQVGEGCVCEQILTQRGSAVLISAISKLRENGVAETQQSFGPSSNNTPTGHRRNAGTLSRSVLRASVAGWLPNPRHRRRTIPPPESSTSPTR